MRTLLALLVLSHPLLADDWTRYRGPNGTGVSNATGLPTTWDEKTNVVWKTPVHDKGWSSPVVLGKQVWVTTAREDGKAQWAVCVDRDSGKVVHDVKVFDTPKVPYFFMKDYNSHASPTPAIEPGRVYVHFGSAGTACLDTETGKVLWSRRDLPCDHWRAPGSSPVLWNDLVILTFDGYDRQYLAALRKRDGSTAWEAKREVVVPDDNGDLKKAYSTPSLIEANGRTLLVSPGATNTLALDPATGQEVWKVLHGGMNTATPPVVAGGKVFVTTGNPSHLVAIGLDGKVAYKVTREVPQRPGPISHNGLLFLVSDNGIATCLDPKTGDGVWTRRLGGQFYSSPVCAEGRLYVFDKKGKGTVLTADREGKVLATNQLAGGVIATPAIAGKALYVRTNTHLYRVEQR
ncbi:MAG: PQQ-binding-like beta-propeller repeat protein [Gemmataceae bacterium]